MLQNDAEEMSEDVSSRQVCSLPRKQPVCIETEKQRTPGRISLRQKKKNGIMNYLIWLIILEEIYNFVWGNLSAKKPRQMKTRLLLASKTIMQKWKGIHYTIHSLSMKITINYNDVKM